MAVKVYTKPNCPPCYAVKRALTEAGVEFTEHDASEHLDYLEGLGARSAPVIVDGDLVIHGFNPEQIKRLQQ